MEFRRTFHCKQVRLDVEVTLQGKDSYHVLQGDESSVQVGGKELEESSTLGVHLLKLLGAIKVGRVGAKRLQPVEYISRKGKPRSTNIAVQVSFQRNI